MVNFLDDDLANWWWLPHAALKRLNFVDATDSTQVMRSHSQTVVNFEWPVLCRKRDMINNVL